MPLYTVWDVYTEGPGLPITPATSANQNATSTISREKHAERPSCFSHTLEDSINRAKRQEHSEKQNVGERGGE